MDLADASIYRYAGTLDFLPTSPWAWSRSSRVPRIGP
jgi:hypothetical protein